jgi:hypothetical protein
MRTINTSGGPKQYDSNRPGHVNTSDLLEPPQMRYEDEEPDILTVLPAGDWCAVVEGVAVPMPVWVVLDDASMYGVVVGVDGCIDLTADVEKHPNFSGYKQANNRQGETK